MNKSVRNLAEIALILSTIQSNGDEQKSLAKIGLRRGRDRTMYIAGLSTGLGSENGNLIVAGTKKQTGVTNFEDGNILPKGTHLLVLGARILFDTTTGVTLPTALWKNEAPAPWKNGELSINQGAMLMNVPVTDVTNFKASTGNDDDFRALVTPVLLRPDTSFSIVAALAAGTLTDIAYKVELRCVELVADDKA